MDYGNSYSATVMKFDGTNWVNVGTAGFSPSWVQWTSLAFSPSGQPYVAFEDIGNSAKATVMKFDGTNWVIVGTAGFSSGQVGCTRLAFSPFGQPYVVYQDWANFEKATVMKYDFPAGINNLKESGLSVYPDPAIDKITVEISGVTKESNLAIVDIEGQELITRQITEPKTTIDISDLPSGVYLLRLTSQGMVKVGKIIKQ